MKKLILTGIASMLFLTSAIAGDLLPSLIVKGPAINPAINWTGFYAGLHGGWTEANAKVTDTNGGVNPGPFGYSPDGAMGGGQIGYNYQLSRFVLGLEGDVGYAGLNGKGVIGSASATSHQDLTLDSGLYADFTGRFGVTWGNALFYAKGGYAFYDGSAKQKTTNPGYVTTGTGQWNGYTVGGGVEYLLVDRWSIKGEYTYTDFGSLGGKQTNVGDKSSPIPYDFNNSTNMNFQKVIFGVNYRLN